MDMNENKNKEISVNERYLYRRRR